MRSRRTGTSSLRDQPLLEENSLLAARPILWHNRTGTCWHPYVKGYTLMVNSVYNGWRMEDVWLDK